MDRRENRIKTLSFEADGVHNQADIERVVGEVIQSGEVPEGVKIVFRRHTDFPLWDEREDYDINRFKSSDCFADLGFNSSIL